MLEGGETSLTYSRIHTAYIGEDSSILRYLKCFRDKIFDPKPPHRLGASPSALGLRFGQLGQWQNSLDLLSLMIASRVLPDESLFGKKNLQSPMEVKESLGEVLVLFELSDISKKVIYFENIFFLGGGMDSTILYSVAV